jgi:tetratricopeptide (TPR) repeat protein
MKRGHEVLRAGSYEHVTMGYRFLIIILLIIPGCLMAQDYDAYMQKADSAYWAKNYTLAEEYFKLAFTINTEKHLYNAACAASLANDFDVAFDWLNLAVDKGFTNIDQLQRDPDLSSLHGDKRWAPLLEKVQSKLDIIEANYDKPLQKELIQIFYDDQDIRNRFIEAERQFGYQSRIKDSLIQVMIKVDSINLVKIKNILDTKGWVGKDRVGEQASASIFLVIQHSDLKTQQQYLPMMREAVKKGNASAANLALLEDRVALGEGRKQVYGSQICYDDKSKRYIVCPIEDPDNVDTRRAEVGLGPIANYVKNWGITWNPDDYR